MENVGCFGMHAVDDRWRVQGPTSVDLVVKRYGETVDAVLDAENDRRRRLARAAAAAASSSSCGAITAQGACQTDAACAWRSSDATCIAAVSSADDDDGAAASTSSSGGSVASTSAAADDDACASLAKGACQTSSSCEWSAADAACFTPSTTTSTAVSDDDVDCAAVLAKSTCEGYASCSWHTLSSACESVDAADDTVPCADYAAKGSCENTTYCAWDESASSCENGQSIADDDYDDIQKEPCSSLTYETRCAESAKCEWDEMIGSCLQTASVAADASALATAYSPLMDHATVLYTANLDAFAKSWTISGTDFIRVRWRDDHGNTFYSLVAKVPYSVSCVEMVGKSLSDGVHLALDDPHVRLPAAAFTTAGINHTDFHEVLPQPLAISKATTDTASVAELYANQLQSSVLLSRRSESYASVVFALPGADLAVRFVSRPSNATDGDALSVEDLETIKRSARHSSYKTNYCGMDRWYDNHYGYQRSDMTDDRIEAIATNLTHSGTGWHCTSDGIFIWEPTGDTIFLARRYRTSVTYGDDAEATKLDVRDVLQTCWDHGVDAADLCSQGYCFDDFRNLTANASVCTGIHSYHHNSSSEPSATVNHTVNETLHWELGYVGRNASLDDDTAAEWRCANTTSVEGCEKTAQCEWDDAGVVCYDPSVDAKTTRCTAISTSRQCAWSSLSCKWTTDEDCLSTSDCPAFGESDCQTADLCEWRATSGACKISSSSASALSRFMTEDSCAAITCKGSCERDGCEWHETSSCELTSEVADDDDDDCGATTAADDDDDGDDSVTCTTITKQGECQTSSSCEWRSSDSSCISKTASSSDDASSSSSSTSSSTSSSSTCTAITMEGECQTSTSCEWRSSDSSCIAKAR